MEMKLYHTKYKTQGIGGTMPPKEYVVDAKKGKISYFLNQALIWLVIIALFVAVVKKIYLGHLL